MGKRAGALLLVLALVVVGAVSGKWVAADDGREVAQTGGNGSSSSGGGTGGDGSSSSGDSGSDGSSGSGGGGDQTSGDSGAFGSQETGPNDGSSGSSDSGGSGSGGGGGGGTPSPTNPGGGTTPTSAGGGGGGGEGEAIPTPTTTAPIPPDEVVEADPVECPEAIAGDDVRCFEVDDANAKGAKIPNGQGGQVVVELPDLSFDSGDSGGDSNASSNDTTNIAIAVDIHTGDVVDTDRGGVTVRQAVLATVAALLILMVGVATGAVFVRTRQTGTP